MNNFFQGQYISGSKRLQNWDYGSNGKYFVTICTKNKKPFLGNLVDGKIAYTQIGEITKLFWKSIPEHHPFTILDGFVIMPDHLHGIIIIRKEHGLCGQNKFGPQTQNLGAVIRGFKGAVTKFANEQSIDFKWQPGYFDKVIRNEHELDQIREYIIKNPHRWELKNSNTK